MTTPDPRVAAPSPTQIPRNAVAAAMPAPAADICVNFNLTDGRVVCLSVPVGIAENDVPFILAILQGQVTAAARYSHRLTAAELARRG
jgi:hypothetical protein